jgi:hypothetical protein
MRTIEIGLSRLPLKYTSKCSLIIVSGFLFMHLQ